MLHEDNLKAFGFERKFVLDKIMYLKSQMVTSFSFEELMIAVNYCDRVNKDESKQPDADFPIDITMKEVEDPDDAMSPAQPWTNIDSKFFRAMALFQIKDFQTAKSMFQRVILVSHEQEARSEFMTDEQKIFFTNSIHMVNLINLTDLKAKNCSEDELK